MPGAGKLLETVDAEQLTWDEAIRLFETVYMASRNLSVETRVHYKCDVTQLADFLTGQGITWPIRVQLSHLHHYMAHLDEKGYSGVSRRRKIASIRGFFGFLTAYGLMAHDPTEQLAPPEREYKEPRFLTTQEYRTLLNVCRHHPRDAAIIELLLQTGIRLSEAARLTLCDVELPTRIDRDPTNTGSLAIRGKGRKNRTLPLNFRACRALKTWLSIRPKIDEPALFVTRFRAPMGKRAIQRMVGKYLAAAGIHHASVHSLRHTMATHHVSQGTSLKTLQEALGHENLSSTSVYISTAKVAMKRDLQDHAL